MRRFFERALSLIFPPRCSCCHEILPYYSDAVLCDGCAEKWEEEINAYCRVCHKKVTECTCVHDNCKRIVKKLFSVSVYSASDSVTDRIVLSAKDHKDKKLFEFMAEKMVGAAYAGLPSLGDTLVTFVPRSEVTKRKIGHDQSEMLAKIVASELGVTSCALLKKKGTRQQKTLRAKEREDNAKRSYVLRDGACEKVKDRTLLLIDDVVTTGASISACAELLIEAGAKEIYALTFAKTMKRK